ncbi:hypothetical protein BDQ17DRAFT_1328539 [Cyathus striatus]|nr:hypothetical protein BDQ17DRAFT_1328539 [Cyathus striatus]
MCGSVDDAPCGEGAAKRDAGQNSLVQGGSKEQDWVGEAVENVDTVAEGRENGKGMRASKEEERGRGERGERRKLEKLKFVVRTNCIYIAEFKCSEPFNFAQIHYYVHCQYLLMIYCGTIMDRLCTSKIINYIDINKLLEIVHLIIHAEYILWNVDTASSMCTTVVFRALRETVFFSMRIDCYFETGKLCFCPTFPGTDCSRSMFLPHYTQPPASPPTMCRTTRRAVPLQALAEAQRAAIAWGVLLVGCKVRKVMLTPNEKEEDVEVKEEGDREGGRGGLLDNGVKEEAMSPGVGSITPSLDAPGGGVPKAPTTRQTAPTSVVDSMRVELTFLFTRCGGWRDCYHGCGRKEGGWMSLFVGVYAYVSASRVLRW